MQRFLKRRLIALVPAALVVLALWVPAGASDLGVQNTTLGCSDGTNLSLALNTAALTGLTSAVAAINANPAGLSCGLSANAPSSSSGNPQHDYAVGGGQVLTVCGLKNFALSAHVNDETMTQGVGGTFNLTLPATGCGGGHLVSKVDCLSVYGATAKLTALVTKSDGFFSNLFPVGTHIFVKAIDNTTDMLGWTGTSAMCSFQFTSLYSVVHGNISVHDDE